ncbi:MAG: multidrug ABC transporter permease [Candidatus Reconcilbacillus cellulovorans]|uniref:Multidrug ABC transporter permease n=1 Tax=Candidatus Reconcilbacillus cellulovorans TaxID=1906605 RepID=A0A2A6E0T2_9BACL|nr:MAG: multidrug ABC transporter permease [Candidatus Reconcilbacillus cellulovorans]
MRRPWAVLARQYAALLRMKYGEMLAYRPATFVWMTGAMVQPIITMFVWMNIEPERSDAFLFYFLAVVFVERMTVAWDVWELDREIREGTFAYRILQPVHPIHWAIAENIVYKGLFLVLLAPVWAVAAVFVPALRPTMDAAQTALFLCAVVVGAAVRFLLGYTFGLLAFRWTKVTGAYVAVEAVGLFLSGRIAPMELLPPWLQTIAFWSPFRYMIGFPIEIATGAVVGPAIGAGFAVALAWAALFALALRAAWRSGLRRNQAVGG